MITQIIRKQFFCVTDARAIGLAKYVENTSSEILTCISRECEYRSRMYSRKNLFPKNSFLHVLVLCRGVIGVHRKYPKP